MKDCWWNENAENGKDTAPLETPISPEGTKTEPPITGMLIQSGAQWMYSVTKQESVPNANDFLIDSGAATLVCQQESGRQPGWKSQEGLEWSSSQPQDINSQRLATSQFAWAHETVSTWASDFQIAPKNTGLQRSIISVGQMCDRRNIITFRSTGGTILNEFTGHRIEFERAAGVYRLRAGRPAKMQCGPVEKKVLMGFEAGATEAQSARPGIVLVLPSEAEVGATRVNTFAVSKLVPTLRTCEGQREPIP